MSPFRATLLLFIRQILLHHTPNLAVSIEVLSYCAVLVKRPSYFLCSSSNGAIGYKKTPVSLHIQSMDLYLTYH